MPKILTYTSRTLAILLGLFLILFALDVFAGGKTLTQVLVPLLIRFIPSAVIFITTVIAWKYRKTGGIIFISLACIYTLMILNRIRSYTFLIVMIPLILIGVLFLMDGLLIKGKRVK